MSTHKHKAKAHVLPEKFKTKVRGPEGRTVPQWEMDTIARAEAKRVRRGLR